MLTRVWCGFGRSGAVRQRESASVTSLRRGGGDSEVLEGGRLPRVHYESSGTWSGTRQAKGRKGSRFRLQPPKFPHGVACLGRRLSGHIA